MEHSTPQAQQNSTVIGDHVMPGLLPGLVDHFHTPRKHFTIRGTARAKDVRENVVTTALIRDLHERVMELEGKVFGRPSVRTFRVVNGGRSAA